MSGSSRFQNPVRKSATLVKVFVEFFGSSGKPLGSTSQYAKISSFHFIQFSLLILAFDATYSKPNKPFI